VRIPHLSSENGFLCRMRVRRSFSRSVSASVRSMGLRGPTAVGGATGSVGVCCVAVGPGVTGAVVTGGSCPSNSRTSSESSKVSSALNRGSPSNSSFVADQDGLARRLAACGLRLDPRERWDPFHDRMIQELPAAAPAKGFEKFRAARRWAFGLVADSIPKRVRERIWQRPVVAHGRPDKI
jgi:hypothetical protein